VAISFNDLRNGLTVEVNGEIYQVVSFQHVKPGKGAAFMRTTLKNLKTQKTMERTFKPSDKIKEAYIETKRLQYLYKQHAVYHFMDMNTFEEVGISKEDLGNMADYLLEGLEIDGFFYDQELLYVELPMFINMTVTKTAPGVKGDRATAGTKPATLETGLTIQVPLFIKQDDAIRIDTRTRSYIERV